MATLEEALAQLDPVTRQRVTNTLQAGQAMSMLMADPEASQVVNRAADGVAKKRNPAYQSVDDMAKPIVDRALAIVDEKFAARDKQAADAAASNALADRIAHYKQTDGFTDEGIAGVLKIMQDKGVADFDIAAREYRREHPSQADMPARMTDRMYWNVEGTMGTGSDKPFFFPEDGTSSITANPDAWERDTALKYLSGEIALP